MHGERRSSALVQAAPHLSLDEATRIADARWGLSAQPAALESERDQNFLVTTADGTRFVLKVANSLERREALEAQNAAMAHLAARDPTLGCPRVVPSLNGDDVVTVRDADGAPLFVRLLTWVPGTVLGTIRNRPPELLESVGAFVARLTEALQGFTHPGAQRRLHWDLANAPAVVRDCLPAVDRPDRRRVVERALLQFLGDALPTTGDLHRSIVHNDANDHNLLVAGEEDRRAVTGILDFGDLVESYTVGDLAVAAAYAGLHAPDPFAAVQSVVAGYRAVRGLPAPERSVLFDLVVMRLCMSVTIAAHQRRHRPDNAYLSISEDAAWSTLERLVALPPLATRQSLQAAWGPSASAAPDPTPPPEELLARRRRRIGPSLRLAYQQPLTIVRGAGQYLFDDTGRAFLDTVNNVCHVGHAHPAVVDALHRQSAVLNTNTRYLHELLVRYADRLSATLPEPLTVCYLVNSGSEANDLALRLARARTGGTDVIVLEGAYHGHTSSLVDISPYKFSGPGGLGPRPHVRVVPLPDRYRGRYRGADAGARYAGHVGEAAGAIRHEGRRLAAFFCESLPGCAGQVILPSGYLRDAFAEVRAAGGVCVADEVQVGFGRVGSHFWGFELQGVVPDIVTLGKPIGNGHPLGAVITTREIADAFDTGMEYFNTFGGNPVSCAVGLAVLDVIEREDLQAHALTVGRYLEEALGDLADRHACVGDVRGAGLFLGVELVADREHRTPAPAEAARVVEHLKASGVLSSTDGLAGNVLKIKPPLPFTAGDADLYVSALDGALSALRT